MVFTLPLSSSASPCPSFLTDLLYCCNTFNNGGSLSTTAKLGPQANRLSCAVVKGLMEILMTHLAFCWSCPVAGVVVVVMDVKLLGTGV